MENLSTLTQDLAREISSLDPLAVDNFMVNELPVLNQAADVNRIVEAGVRVLPNTGRIEEMSYAENQAALRDLGMIASSIVRHGVDIREVREIETTLVSLGNKYDEMPRETVFHYGPWNPDNGRLRTFTGTEGEAMFIDSFRKGMVGLDRSIDKLIESQKLDTRDLGYGNSLEEARDGFQAMVDAMVAVRRTITPEFFTFEMRPYFPVLNIGGRDYQAPGGAQMPMLLIDRILWGVDMENEEYHNYFAESRQYLPRMYREVDELVSPESVVSRIGSDTESCNESIESARQGALELLSSIQKFRFPHLKTARDNFAHRSEESKGSGGYTPDILDNLIGWTNEARNLLKVQ